MNQLKGLFNKSDDSLASGAIEPTRHNWGEQMEQEAKEREEKKKQEQIELYQRILAAWQSDITIKLTHVWIGFVGAQAQEWFVDTANLAKLRNIHDFHAIDCSVYPYGGDEPTRLHLRSDLVCFVQERPEQYFLFEGAPTLVPEVEDDL